MWYHKLSHPLTEITVVLLFFVGCSAPAATPVPSTTIPPTPTPVPSTVTPPTPTPSVLMTSPELLIGDWQPLSDNRDAMFLQINSDGTCRQSYSLDRLVNAPEAESTWSFEGTNLLLTTVKLSGVKPCASPTAKYEVRLMADNQIQLVATEETCAQRRNSTQYVYQRIPSGLPQGPDAVWHLVVISDSSLSGVGNALASQIEKEVGVEVVPDNFALSALSAGAVLQALQTGKAPIRRLDALPAALRDAEVVVMFVNSVDSVDPEKPLDYTGCFYSSAPSCCEPASFEKWTTDLKAIWAEIFKLRQGQPTILRATDLYNPLVSDWNNHGVFEACTECWENMSNAARLAAEAYDIPFLSRFEAFNGVSHNEDPREKGYIGSDGEHLSDLGVQYTAELLSQMGYEPMSRP